MSKHISIQAEFSHYIKLIGKGKRAGKYLTQSQAQRAMFLLLNHKDNDISKEQVGAFLMLLRVREESEEELAGFVAACRESLPASAAALPKADLDLGCYAGKRRHLPWLVLAILALTQNGYNVFIHGTQEPESSRLYLNHVWQAFNWPIAKNAEQATDLMTSDRFCYMDLADIHPAMYHLIQLRSQFGLRSCINTLGRMLNPSRSLNSLHGVFHQHFDARHIQVADRLNDNNVACFRGDGGEIEVNPEREFDLHLRQQNKINIIPFPALMTSWQVKPKYLNPNEVKQLWEGKVNNLYGEKAVIGTIATMLCLLKTLDADTALQTATDFWNKRDKQWPNLNSRQ
jgi:anthranilate phosphoribosyltransferase